MAMIRTVVYTPAVWVGRRFTCRPSSHIRPRFGASSALWEVTKQGGSREAPHGAKAVRRWSLVFHVQRSVARALRRSGYRRISGGGDGPRYGTVPRLRLRRDGDARGSG